MSQLKVSSIVDTNSGNTVTINGATPTVNNTMGRNRIINGDMRIDQRNAGASVSLNGNQYIVDRFYSVASISGKLTAQQNAGSVTPPTGFTKYLGFTSQSAYSSGSTDQFSFRQAIEGFNIADLAWGTASAKTVTLSFQAYSSLTGTFSGSVYNSAANRVYVFSYTISSANTWTSISVSIAGDTTGTWTTDNTAGMTVQWNLGTGSTYLGTAGSWGSTYYAGATGSVSVVGTNGATFYITGVQLEVGSVATEFERRPYGTELALCYRYFISISQPRLRGVCDGTNFQRMGLPLGVTMRTSPTVTFSGSATFYNGSATGTGTTASATYSEPNSIELDIDKASGTSTSATPAAAYVTVSNTSVVACSAEL